ncbi:MAG: ABC transporter permease [Burkholderiales bacterium]|nr:ABC transporter permease [Burkholderiales bacterium]OJX06367.1 MAG: peptide ABC transporter permease [Burkholderiales bacterium 70-64]
MSTAAEALRGRPHELFASLRGWGREILHDRAGLAGLALVVLLVAVALAAPLIAPHDPAAQDLRARLLPPVWLDKGSWNHLLGTDHLGRDVLSRLIHGSRVSLAVGVGVVLLAGGFGTVMGLLAGYFGGRTDGFIMRWVDTQVAFPGLLLALVILAVVGPSIVSLIVVLSINGWMVYARMVRGSVLSVRQLPYVEAAEMIGCRSRRVVFRHILPNLVSPLLTLAILEFARIVLAEAALSFLGLGVQPPATSWGLDVASGKEYMFRAWWLVTFPGAAIAATVLGINLLASWIRIASDPQEREKSFARRAVRARRRQA